MRCAPPPGFKWVYFDEFDRLLFEPVLEPILNPKVRVAEYSDATQIAANPPIGRGQYLRRRPKRKAAPADPAPAPAANAAPVDPSSDP